MTIDEWTITHSHFLQMGGFRLKCPQSVWDKYKSRLPFHYKLSNQEMWEGVLTTGALVELVNDGVIKFPDVKEDILADRDKSDAFLKFFTILQLLWFSIQIFARVNSHLEVTPMEITTIALVTNSLFMYFFWFNKPFNVATPEYVSLVQESSLSIGVQSSILSSPSTAPAPASSTTQGFDRSSFPQGDYNGHEPDVVHGEIVELAPIHEPFPPTSGANSIDGNAVLDPKCGPEPDSGVEIRSNPELLSAGRNEAVGPSRTAVTGNCRAIAFIRASHGYCALACIFTEMQESVCTVWSYVKCTFERASEHCSVPAYANETWSTNTFTNTSNRQEGRRRKRRRPPICYPSCCGCICFPIQLALAVIVIIITLAAYAIGVVVTLAVFALAILQSLAVIGFALLVLLASIVFTVTVHLLCILCIPIFLTGMMSHIPLFSFEKDINTLVAENSLSISDPADETQKHGDIRAQTMAMFYAEPFKDVYLASVIMGITFGVIFGGIHFCAIGSPFPSRGEHITWIVASGYTVLPFIGVFINRIVAFVGSTNLLGNLVDAVRKVSLFMKRIIFPLTRGLKLWHLDFFGKVEPGPGHSYKASFYILILSRICIIGLSIASFRSLSKSELTAVSWIDRLPHV